MKEKDRQTDMFIFASGGLLSYIYNQIMVISSTYIKIKLIEGYVQCLMDLRLYSPELVFIILQDVSVWQCTCQCVAVHMSVYGSAHVSVWQCIYMSVYGSAHVSVYGSA